MKNNLLLTIITLLLLTSCLLPSQGGTSTPEPIPPTSTSTPTDRSIYKDGLNPVYHSILNELPYASLYSIDFVIADDLYHVTGSETVIYTNAEDIALNEVKFRLFPNILGGEMTVENVMVNGEAVTPNYALNESLITIPFKDSLEPEKSITISMDFNITVPQTVELNYGVQAYFDDVLTLAHAYPVVTVYDDEGWNAEIPPQAGDVTYTDMSFFIVIVDAPKEVTLVGSGRETSRQDN